MGGQHRRQSPLQQSGKDAASRAGLYADVLAASPWPMLLLSPTGAVLAASDHPDVARSALASRVGLYLAALHAPAPWSVPAEAWCERALPDGTLCCERLQLRPTRWGASLAVTAAADAAATPPGAGADPQTARLAALGFMVAGVCHEVTNPLTSLRSIVQILRGDAARSPELLDKGLATISGSVQRILDISRRLVTFSRVGDEPRTRFAVDDAVDEALVVLRQQSLLQGVQVLRQRDDAALVTGRFGQVREIFLNLLVNAAHALQGQGQLRLTTVQRAETVLVDLADSGPGVPPALRSRVFEPFFTTKRDGSGTGLGLSISREIAIEHGGSIDLLDAPEGGATFRVALPRAA